jgi:hypothetical protein
MVKRCDVAVVNRGRGFDVEGNPMTLKTQLAAWSKAIMILDASEVLTRDLIERDLAGHTGTPHSLRAGLRAIPIANRLVLKIKPVREDAIKAAFRLLRSRLGDVKILDQSFAVWAQAFAKNDLETIRTAIISGLLAGIDNIEIARRVVGSMGLNGVDGVTEYTRHKLAHLGRASISKGEQHETGTGQSTRAIRDAKSRANRYRRNGRAKPRTIRGG